MRLTRIPFGPSVAIFAASAAVAIGLTCKPATQDLCRRRRRPQAIPFHSYKCRRFFSLNEKSCSPSGKGGHETMPPLARGRSMARLEPTTEQITGEIVSAVVLLSSRLIEVNFCSMATVKGSGDSQATTSGPVSATR